MGAASGDQSQTVTSPSAVWAERMSSWAGYFSQITDAENEAAGGTAEVAQAGGAAAGGGFDPAVAGLGALANLEAVGGELGEGVVAPGRDEVEVVGHGGAPFRQWRGGEAGDLRFAHGGAGIAAEAGDAADGLGEEAVVFSGEADVAVVRGVGERDVEADAETVDEVFVFVSVENEGVHHAQRFAVGVQVKPDDKGQPGAVACGRFLAPLDADDGAHGAGLLDDDAFGLALETFGRGDEIGLVLAK